MNTSLKQKVKNHWEDETCGIRYGASTYREEWLREIAETRYSLEPHILDFAQFEKGRGKKILEIGVGAGVDFSQWIGSGANATGIDLTEAAISLTKERLQSLDVQKSGYHLEISDAENLPFQNESFDIVYSWGVLHHTPDTPKAFRECFRVLKPGGTLKAMIYHRRSVTSFLFWVRHALFAGRPFMSLRDAVYKYLESPGTKTYTITEARKFLARCGFTNISLETKLCAGDLLMNKPSKKYQSKLYRLVWKFYPRWLVKLLGDRFGLELLITASRPLLRS